MSKPIRSEIIEAERTLSKLFSREYSDPGGPETVESAFNLGMSDGFTLALRGLLDQAFPRRDARQ